MTSPLNWQDFLKQAELPAKALCLHNPHQLHSLIRVTGKDAETFLHAQLSNSVIGLQEHEVRFAAWCNAKGRVWTLVRYWKDGDSIILRMPADQAEDSIKRLRMFVLRSDVQLEILDWRALQFIGPDAEEQLRQAMATIKADHFNIPLPGAWPLYEIWSASPASSEVPELPAEMEALPRILAGIPEVFAKQREEWIPQMLNLDQLGGIDFRKGCYPGQEIVAKLHYKGGLKQRMFQLCAAQTDTSLPLASEITDAAGNRVGQIVEQTFCGNSLWLTAVLRLEARNNSLQSGQTQLNIIPQ